MKFTDKKVNSLPYRTFLASIDNLFGMASLMKENKGI